MSTAIRRQGARGGLLLKRAELDGTMGGMTGISDDSVCGLSSSFVKAGGGGAGTPEKIERWSLVTVFNIPTEQNDVDQAEQCK
jgi:hypothetical protein